ncbi:CaiB/BaiF CoA transferase family protein [Gordonia humi]|uniref:Alpha-methylacyl-CoA racemase n=1 Tax=Gordonia humi TaxID=686429 RepID=A0A840F7M1_9ACTN|nr:CaiB/BaiF CoA-transferase family protein [Gordonia humi]MBB4137886.1 alpha-methylacyl-CoA racemase [Gordonia humi]
MTGPLAGLKVVELGGIGPGPHAAMMLADLGADVVRVERPGGALDLTGGRPDYLLRGRRSVSADLRGLEGLDVVRRLLAKADVLIEGFRPGVAERLGIGPSDVEAFNNRLIYGRMTGWGQDGPWARRAGHDINYISITGALHAIGRTGEPPAPPLNLVGDFGGGSMFLVTGVLAALWERERSGRGQVVDTAMIDGASALMQMMWSMLGQGTWSTDRGSNLLDGGAPFYDTYRCGDDRFVAVGAIEPQFYAALLDGLDIDPAELPDQLDRSGWPTIRARFTERFATRPRDEWARLFDGTDACVSPVLDFAEAADHPQMAARENLIEIDGIRQAAPAPRFSRTSPGVPATPPVPGGDTEEVLTDWEA